MLLLKFSKYDPKCSYKPESYKKHVLPWIAVFVDTTVHIVFDRKKKSFSQA